MTSIIKISNTPFHMDYIFFNDAYIHTVQEYVEAEQPAPFIADFYKTHKHTPSKRFKVITPKGSGYSITSFETLYPKDIDALTDFADNILAQHHKMPNQEIRKTTKNHTNKHNN